MIRLEAVGRAFQMGGQPVHALQGVTERIEPGEHVAIMGPSGSGKSTLLNLIGLLDRPTSGRLWLDGREVSGLSEGERTALRRDLIGFVFQTFHLVARLDARANVELPLVFSGVPPGERRARAEAALEAVGLAERLHHRPSQLSGGERQRIALARATIRRPRVLLADEPTGNLDTRSGAQVLDLLEALNAGGLTLVVVTHDPGVARRAARALALVDGRIARRISRAALRDLSTPFGPETETAE